MGGRTGCRVLRMEKGSSKARRSENEAGDRKRGRGSVDRVLAARVGLLVAFGGWARVERPWYANRTP